MLRRNTSFGPTCRLVSSPEVGPGATVGTLKQGYPLLLYKDSVLTRLSLSRVVKVLCVGPDHDSPQSGDILQGINSKFGPPWESAGPLEAGPPRLV
jgi:hypothetical protein